MNESADDPSYTLLEQDGSALIGVLAVVAGHVLAGQGDTDLVGRLGQRLHQDGAIPDPTSSDDVVSAIEDLIAQVRFVAGQIDDERPERGLLRPEDDRTSPPKGVSAWVTAWETPMGEGPTASCVLGKVTIYSTGVEIELNLAWTPTAEERTRRVPPRAHGSTARSFQDEPIGDWQMRIDLPDGRTATTVLSGDDVDESTLEEDEEQGTLRMYTQSVETRARLESLSARWLCWVPVDDASSLRITSAWPSGAIPETSVDIDLTLDN